MFPNLFDDFNKVAGELANKIGIPPQITTQNKNNVTPQLSNNPVEFLSNITSTTLSFVGINGLIPVNTIQPAETQNAKSNRSISRASSSISIVGSKIDDKPTGRVEELKKFFEGERNENTNKFEIVLPSTPKDSSRALTSGSAVASRDPTSDSASITSGSSSRDNASINFGSATATASDKGFASSSPSRASSIASNFDNSNSNDGSQTSDDAPSSVRSRIASLFSRNSSSTISNEPPLASPPQTSLGFVSRMNSFFSRINHKSSQNSNSTDVTSAPSSQNNDESNRDNSSTSTSLKLKSNNETDSLGTLLKETGKKVLGKIANAEVEAGVKVTDTNTHESKEYTLKLKGEEVGRALMKVKSGFSAVLAGAKNGSSVIASGANGARSAMVDGARRTASIMALGVGATSSAVSNQLKKVKSLGIKTDLSGSLNYSAMKTSSSMRNGASVANSSMKYGTSVVSSKMAGLAERARSAMGSELKKVSNTNYQQQAKIISYKASTGLDQAKEKMNAKFKSLSKIDYSEKVDKVSRGVVSGASAASSWAQRVAQAAKNTEVTGILRTR